MLIRSVNPAPSDLIPSPTPAIVKGYSFDFKLITLMRSVNGLRSTGNSPESGRQVYLASQHKATTFVVGHSFHSGTILAQTGPMPILRQDFARAFLISVH